MAEVITAGPTDDVESIIGALSPGDELVLEDGMYTLTERFSFDIAGTEAMPIVIRAADGARPHFHRPDASQNIWDFHATWVVLRGIELSGGSAGVRVESASHFTIEECEIHDTADVALRFNNSGATYEYIHVLRNEIHHTGGTGEGMYIGCHSGDCPVSNSLIEGNWVHHTDGPTVDQGDGIELKQGSFSNVIRDNVIHDTMQPCIITYSANGNGPQNVIERNVMWGCGDHAIQSAADAIIRNNIILSAMGSGIASQPHEAGAPSNMEIVHNTILNAGGPAISIRERAGEVLIANNAIYSESNDAILIVGPTDMITIAGNVGAGGVTGGGAGYVDGDIASDFVDADYRGAPPIDVFPAGGGALVAAGDAAHVVDDDFNGTPRAGVADVGAYAFAEGGNPGWILAEGFKQAVTPMPGTDAGPMPGTDAGPTPGTDAGPGSMPTDAGSIPMPPSEEDGGCGCTTIPKTTPSPWALLLLVPLLLRRLRRGCGGGGRG